MKSSGAHFFFVFDGLYLQNGCPSDDTEQRKLHVIFCKLRNELGPVALRRLWRIAPVGHLRAASSIA